MGRAVWTSLGLDRKQSLMLDFVLQRGVELHHLLGQQAGKVCACPGGMESAEGAEVASASGCSVLAVLMWLVLSGRRGLAAAGQLGLPPQPLQEPSLPPGLPASRCFS